MAEAGARRQSSRTIVTRFMTAALALALAGCSTVVPHGRGPERAVAPPPPPVAGPAPAPQTGLPVDVERHRVALLVPLTGPAAAVGRSIADAASLALVDTGGKALRITTYDTAPGAQLAAQKALAEGNGLILGPLLADDVRAVAPTAAAAGVPVIAFSNDSSVLGDDVWLLGFSPGQSIDRVVRYAKSRGLTRFAGLIPQGVYGRGAASTLIHTAEAAGGSVVAMQSFNRSPKSIADAVTSLSKQKFDAVLIADSGRIAVAAAPLLRKNGVAAKLLGTELWNAEPGLNAAPVMAGAWFASVDDTTFGQFATRYKARYDGRTPYRLASLGYDGVLLAARIASDWKMGAPFPVDRLADEGGFSGVDGAFRFSGGHVAERALAVHQVGAGGTVVSPAPTAF
ncbi:penicillin-binding protein activator [Sphingomonas nostoxanthinifaciens]|uniref:penicillin-binding protein activator n=1 Tax=Sphingomonas nostoxanthinifaciens TaxID=2872652 RepID=UPI001CC1F1A9|nr:penicillin-binding protein activator [Sphingomonas nostoxanthinifaciens]UAK26220.1 penicillin-binding protein activator [Sphingomonas nostoxanthinifaciens]